MTVSQKHIIDIVLEERREDERRLASVASVTVGRSRTAPETLTDQP